MPDGQTKHPMRQALDDGYLEAAGVLAAAVILISLFLRGSDVLALLIVVLCLATPKPWRLR
jgi:hypothetical protein